MSKEYEYSFKVSSIKEFIKYCKDHDYVLTDEFTQTRTLYKNGGKIMGRITKNVYPDKTVEILNFKDDNLQSNTLKINRESEDLYLNDENRKFAMSLLEILDLEETKVLKRKRYVYEKDEVKFEIDDYTSPKMKVLGIEGNEKKVDKVYEELKELINKLKVEEEN